MKAFRKILVVAGSLALGAGALGIGAITQNGLPKSVVATDASSDVATISLATDQSLTSSSSPWSVTTFAFNSSKKCYSSSTAVESTIKYYSSTCPFAKTPTSIAITLKMDGISTGNYAGKKTATVSALDSAGAIISTSTATSTPNIVKDTWADYSFTVSTSVSAAYGIVFSFTPDAGKVLGVSAATLSYTYTSTDPVLTIDQGSSLNKYKNDSGTLTATSENFSATPTIAWVSSNTGAVTIDSSTGAYSAVGTGSSTITATATAGSQTATSTLTMNVYELTTSATFTYNSLSLPSDYSATETSVIDGTSGYEMVYANLKNNSGTLCFKSSGASFSNSTAWISDISRIVCMPTKAYAVTVPVLTVGTAAKPSTGTAVSGVLNANGNNYIYFDVAAAGSFKYFYMTATAEFKLTGFVVQTVDDEISEFMTWIQAKTAGDVTTADCASNYKTAKAMVLGLSASAKTAFQNSIDTTIVAQRNRYVYWCSVNGDLTPFSGSIASGANNVIFSQAKTEKAALPIALWLSVLSLVAIGAFAVYRKRKA